MIEFAVNSAIGQRQHSLGKGVHEFCQSFESSNFEFELEVDNHQHSLRIRNSGCTLDLPWSGGTIRQGDCRTVRLPVQLTHGSTTIEIRCSESDNTFLTIERPRNKAGEPFVPAALLGQSPAAETLAKWFETLGSLQQWTGGSHQLMEAAVRAVIHPGGMDAALLVMRERETWSVCAQAIPNPVSGFAFRRDLLDRVACTGRTLYDDGSLRRRESDAEKTESVVASPVLSVDGKVSGVVYGIRSTHNKNERLSIRPLEALWTQLLAESIGAGLQRMKAEAKAARTRVIFEQAFSSEVVRELLENPELLKGQQREVTVLFVDLRGFSEISESLGPRETYELLSDLLEHLTTCVIDEGGVIIDYYGDGLAAMWNAPADQHDHAFRACKAAKEMVRHLGPVSQRWKRRIGKSLRIGIGINSGVTQVGNAGSSRRMKYGPRGSVVNVASRLETATKHVDTDILITAATRRLLPQECVTRRVCRAKLAGVSQPIDLYQLCGVRPIDVAEAALAEIARYEKALSLYEQGKTEEALELVESKSLRAEVSCDLLENQLRMETQETGSGGACRTVFDLTAR